MLVGLQGQQASVGGKLDCIAATQANKETGIKIIEQNLAKCNSNLDDANSRLKRYTYNMYNRFVSMWENDVALARQDIERFTAEKAKTEQLLQTARDGSAMNLGDAKFELLAEKTKLVGQIEAQSEALQKSKNKFEEIAGMIKVDRNELKALCSSGDAVNFDHLMQIQDAMTHYAARSKDVASTHEATRDGWKEWIYMMLKNAEKVSKSKTVERMRIKLKICWELTVKTHPKMVVFFRKAHMVPNLSMTTCSLPPPQASLEWIDYWTDDPTAVQAPAATRAIAIAATPAATTGQTPTDTAATPNPIPPAAALMESYLTLDDPDYPQDG